MQTALFHTHIDGIQVLAYNSTAEVPEQSRRIVFATHSNGLDISFGMNVVLARDMARAITRAADTPHRANLDKYDDRCMEFFGSVQGGVVSRSNEDDPQHLRPTIRISLTGESGLDKPRTVVAVTEPKARALAAALLSACESVIAEHIAPLATPPTRTPRGQDGWPGDADDIAAAAEIEAVLPDTVGATNTNGGYAATNTNGGW